MNNRFKITIWIVIALILNSCSIMTQRYASHETFPQPVTDYRPKGILEDAMIPSDEPKLHSRRALVYLPADYYQNDDRYPVLYLLHGARGNEVTWIERGRILQLVDSLSSGAYTHPFILVLPNMNSYRDSIDYGHSRAKNAISAFYSVNGTVETFFVSNVVKEIDLKYRTIASKEGRAIAGMSLGAMQSIYISAGNPDIFGSIGLFSPMAHSIIQPGKYSGFYSHLWEKMGNQFVNPPQDYCIMIGKTDFFYPHMCNWHKKLEKKAYSHSFYVTNGGHEWYNWEAFAARFMSSCSAFRL